MTNIMIMASALSVFLGLTGIFLLSKCFFLAPFRMGRLMMLANVCYETLNKRYHWSRWSMDAVGLILLVAGWSWLTGPWGGVAVGCVLCLAWAYTLLIDVKWRTDELAQQDSRYGLAAAPRQIPLPIPKLILTVRGPILDRGRTLCLGDWPEGHSDGFDLLILNPSIVVPQWPLQVQFTVSGDGLSVESSPPGEMKAPEPGEFKVVPFRLRAGRSGSAGEVRVTMTHGDLVITERIRVRQVIASRDVKIAAAAIRRWKGGARAGFGWRGDQDLYDPATFQSEEGLRIALGLSRQFRIPSSLYLSGRLSLDPDELRKFSEHFGFDRRPEGVPGFIEFLRNEVSLSPELEFPFETPRPLAMELGNHMYLHYGTHAAVDPGNDWKWRAEMGSGRYPWQGTQTDSFSEQRDNAVKNVEVIREKLGVTIKSWGVPGRANDADTSRALEAAGMVAASDSDAPAWTNVMKLAPPHHPKGCKHLVEISKKYPGDCNNVYKIAMLQYWLHAAQRTGRVFLYMAHHHLLIHEGTSCYQLTRAFFHYALSACRGDLYPATVTSLGLYWERVLCPQHKWVHITVDESSVAIKNTGSESLDRLPVEIDLTNGCRYMTLVDVPANTSLKIDGLAH